MEANLKNFYIPEEQSIYLLAANDAKKLRNWVALCQKQLNKMGFHDVHLVGKGAFGFVFAGTNNNGDDRVFKFSRITLPQNVRERLEEEGHMLKQLSHPNIPSFIAYQDVKKQSILVMQRGQGIDLHELLKKKGSLPVHTIVNIAIQLADILLYLRNVHILSSSGQTEHKPVIHGDIKPSNLMWDEDNETLSLIDWGSCVYAQLDENGQPIANNVMELMSSDLHTTNAKLGDVYFIGEEQLNGALSYPGFDEQGAAATLYALASNQSCRYGFSAIPPSSLGLPKVFAQVLTDMLGHDKSKRDQAGKLFLSQVSVMKNWYLPELPLQKQGCYLPVWIKEKDVDLDTVVYSSRKSFLRQQDIDDQLSGVKDAQLDKYYKNYLQGMGDNEKAFVAAVSRLSEFPIVGGIALHWQDDGVHIDSNLNLFDDSYALSVNQTINNIVDLARSISLSQGTFKACLFDAKSTLHFERNKQTEPFVVNEEHMIGFEITDMPEIDPGKQHSYFEDGEDPDERLILPKQIMQHIVSLNDIHHTGCIIFEALPKHLKIHNYYHLLDASRYQEFKANLQGILDNIHLINGLGVSGFMKLPYKDAKIFAYQSARPDNFYPLNPREYLEEDKHN